jgi:hypothetical protein
MRAAVSALFSLIKHLTNRDAFAPGVLARRIKARYAARIVREGLMRGLNLPLGSG